MFSASILLEYSPTISATMSGCVLATSTISLSAAFDDKIRASFLAFSSWSCAMRSSHLSVCALSSARSSSCPASVILPCNRSRSSARARSVWSWDMRPSRSNTFCCRSDICLLSNDISFARWSTLFVSLTTYKSNSARIALRRAWQSVVCAARRSSCSLIIFGSIVSMWSWNSVRHRTSSASFCSISAWYCASLPAVATRSASSCADMRSLSSDSCSSRSFWAMRIW